MPENVAVKYKLNEEVKDILVEYLKTKPYSEVEDAIRFLKEFQEMDGDSFRTIISYLSYMPWTEVDPLMRVISSTTEEISIPAQEKIQPADQSAQ